MEARVHGDYCALYNDEIDRTGTGSNSDFNGHWVTKEFPGYQRDQTSFLPDRSKVRDLFDLATTAQMSPRRAVCPRTGYRQCAGSLPGGSRLRAMNPMPG